MALSIINNIAALGAQRSLAAASNNLGKSLARLSSGLRINSAKDDPSGLAISERFRTQIRGLARASANAQDAISFLQTAEGALNETHSILQRMRELAVQAANGILTANDRLEIQKEVDQLSEEIDRIAKSTEFNTKKLLDGSGAALWSADSADITAVITGVVAEGNYTLEKNATPTVNHVIKTDIFQVKESAQGVTNLELNATDAFWDYAVVGGAGAGTLDFDFNGVTTSVAYGAVPTAATLVAAINGDATANDYVFATAAGLGVVITAIQSGTVPNSYTLADATGDAFAGIATAAVPTTLGLDTISGVTAIDNPQTLTAGTGYTLTVDAANGVGADGYTSVNKYTQTGSAATALDAVGGGAHIIATDDSGYLMLEVTSTDNGGIDLVTNSDFRASIDNGQTWYNVSGTNLLAAGAGVVIGTTTIDLDLANVNVQAGDKALYAYQGDRTAANDTLQVTVPGQTGAGPEISYANTDLPNTTTTVEVGSMDASGNVTFGSIDITFGATVTDGTATFDVTAAGGLAQSSTALYFVDRSYDNVGNFIWGDSGQYMTIYNAQGNSASIFIDGGDTLQEVADKIETAIITETANGGLGMASGVAEVDDHVADFVSTATENTDEAVAGTIVIRSPKQGINGKLFFSASEDVLKFFSLADIQDPRDAIDPLTVTVTNAHTGELIGSDTVSDNVLRNVIAGVDVYIDSNVDVSVAWNNATRGFDFTSSPGTEVEHLHVVDARVTFQIGANAGQNTTSYIAQMDGTALATNNVLVIDQEVAQLAIAQVDNAINLVSSERARIGGNISRLEHTINNLNVQAENAIASESRIRDLDMAIEMTEFTKQQLLLQASTAMLAQANQVPQILLQLLR
jgi:flagellin